MEAAKYVYIQTTNRIESITDQGINTFGTWIETDSEKTHDPMDLLFLYTKDDVRRCAEQLKAGISDHCKKILGIQ